MKPNDLITHIEPSKRPRHTYNSYGAYLAKSREKIVVDLIFGFNGGFTIFVANAVVVATALLLLRADFVVWKIAGSPEQYTHAHHSSSQTTQ